MWLLLWWLLLQPEKCQLWPCWRTVIQIQRLYLVSKHWSGEELYAASFLPMCCNPFSILLLQCMVIARKKAAKFAFNNPVNWSPANILGNALHLVSEWHVNSYCFSYPKLLVCVTGLKILCISILGFIVKSEAPVSSSHSWEPQLVGCLLLVLLISCEVHTKLSEKNSET